MNNKPKRDWLAIRAEYEHGTLSQRALGAKHGIGETTIFQRARREKWVQSAKLVRKSAREIDARLQESVSARVEQELAPWIEKEKVRWTKQGFKVAKTGIKRSERFLNQSKMANPIVEASLAKAADTYHKMGRLALGMTDGTSPTGGPVQVNIVCSSTNLDSQS